MNSVLCKILVFLVIAALVTVTLAACSKPKSDDKSASPPSQQTEEPEAQETPYIPPEGTGPSEFYVAPNGKDSNPGTIDKPWATIHHAAEVLRPGDTVYIRQGFYNIKKPIRPRNSGTKDAVITYAAYKNERVIIEASGFNPLSAPGEFHYESGAFLIKDVEYIRVQGIKVMNSYCKGISIENSSNIDIINCSIESTFNCGIAMWDTTNSDTRCRNNRILGNTVINANTWDMLPAGMERRGEPPHEAISIAGAVNFEVAYNHVYFCDKEGIDVKETSKHGRVHHNYIHDVDRQGLYADSWFGVLEDVEFYENVVENCRGAGIAISVEGGALLKNVRFHHNLVINNYGTGVLFGRWGDDGPRQDIKIYNNTIVHNGHGSPGQQGFFWITGGIYLFSANLEGVEIFNNILSDNKAFEIGYSDHYTKDPAKIEEVFAEKGIKIGYNLIDDRNNYEYPLYLGWEGNYAYVNPYVGKNTVKGNPGFIDIQGGDYRLSDSSPAIDKGNPDQGYNDPDDSRGDIGALWKGHQGEFWWKQKFPPDLSSNLNPY